MSRTETYHQPSFSAWLASMHVGEYAVGIAATLYSIFFFASVIWVFFNARARQKSGCIAMLFILLAGWPISLVWWLWLRPPEERAPVRTRRKT